MKRYLAASLFALVASLLAASLLAAQSSEPLNDTFDGSVSGWAPVMHQTSDGLYHAYTTITWLPSADLTIVFPPSTMHADGVVHVVSANMQQYVAEIHKTVYLQPGAYQVRLRVGADPSANWGNLIANLWVNVMGGNTDSRPDGYLSNFQGFINNQFVERTTDVFSVISPGPVTIIISADTAIYVDYVEVIPYASGNTPTPYATSALTPVPTEYQSTPMPMPTQYCRPAAAPSTPGPGEFGVTPTATPDTNGDWQVTDNFSSAALSTQWETSGAGGTVNPNITGPDGAAGVLDMPYSSSPSLVLVRPITPTVYVDGWAMANSIPTGSTAAVHVQLYTSEGTWVDAGSQEFGPGQWYPFHIIVDDMGGYVAIAVYVSGPSGDSAYLDNLAIYNTERLAPVCGFQAVAPGQGVSDMVVYPANKPCPKDTDGFGDVPNNFWGPLFHWMALQFLSVTANFPMHIGQAFAVAIEAFADAPFWRYVAVVGLMFDLRPIIAMALVLLALEVVRLIYSAWRLLLKIIPMMG